MPFHSRPVYERREPKDDQNVWYFESAILFLILFGASVWSLKRMFGAVPNHIPLYDLVILMLAVFRFVRLLTYDLVLRFLRDLFMDIREDRDEEGRQFVVRSKPLLGVRGSIVDLLGCPWCTGMWVGLVFTYLYFVFPPVRYFYLLLAIAGVGSFVQIIANKFGAESDYYRSEQRASSILGFGRRK